MSSNSTKSPFPRISRVQLTRRTLGALSVPTFLGLGLAACGSGGGSGSSNSLRVVDYYNTPADSEIIEATLKDCAEEVGATISREEVPGQNLIQQVLQMSSSNTMPDLLMLDNPDLPEIAQTGALLPLDDFGIDYSGFKDSILETGMYDGQVYGLAPTVNTIAVFYNIQLFEQAGVEIPQTWDELRNVAQILTSGDTYGISFSAVSSYEGTWQFLPFMWSNGGDETNLATPEVAEASQFWDDLVTDGSASQSVVNWSQGDAMDQFKAQRAAMTVNGPWQIADLNADNPEIEWDVFTIPVPTEGETSVAPLGGEVWTIPRTGNQEKQQLAADLLQLFVNAENQLRMGNARSTIPSITSAAEQFAADNPELSTFVEQVSDARARTAQLGTEWPPTAAAIYTANQQVLVEGVDPETAFADAAASLA